MLPAPFNAIPALFAPLHYGYIFYIQHMVPSHKRHVGGDVGGSALSVGEGSRPGGLGHVEHSYKATDRAVSSEPVLDVDADDLSNLGGELDEDDGDDDLSILLFADYDEDVSNVGEHIAARHDCVCSCKQEAHDTHHHATHGKRVTRKFLSICGTVSDITVGLVAPPTTLTTFSIIVSLECFIFMFNRILLMFPCAFYEIYLLLEEIGSHQEDQFLFWISLIITIIGFPFFYVGFVITLLIETLQLRTQLVIERDHAFVYYEKDELLPETTPDIVMKSSKNYVCLSIKVIRLTLPKEFTTFLGFKFSRSVNLCAVVKIGKQILVTPTIQRTERIVWDSAKDFYLCLDDPLDTQIKVMLYDGHTVLGTYPTA